MPYNPKSFILKNTLGEAVSVFDYEKSWQVFQLKEF
jgi:hypothetical protein